MVVFNTNSILDRAVGVHEFGHFLTHLESYRLDHSNLMFFLQRQEELEAFTCSVERILMAAPLTLATSGSRGEEAFDELIDTVCRVEFPRHVMTRPGEDDLADAIEDITMFSFPSEERFDEWFGSLIVVGGSRVDEAKELVAQLARRSSSRAEHS